MRTINVVKLQFPLTQIQTHVLIYYNLLEHFKQFIERFRWAFFLAFHENDAYIRMYSHDFLWRENKHFYYTFGSYFPIVRLHLGESFVMKVHKSSRQMLVEIYAAIEALVADINAPSQITNFAEICLIWCGAGLSRFSNPNRSPLIFHQFKRMPPGGVARCFCAHTFIRECLLNLVLDLIMMNLFRLKRDKILGTLNIFCHFRNVCHFYFGTKWHIKPVEAAKCIAKSDKKRVEQHHWYYVHLITLLLSCCKNVMHSMKMYTFCTFILIHMYGTVQLA